MPGMCAVPDLYRDDYCRIELISATASNIVTAFKGYLKQDYRPEIFLLSFGVFKTNFNKEFTSDDTKGNDNLHAV